jgi:uncharacterized membrane protein YfcA
MVGQRSSTIKRLKHSKKKRLKFKLILMKESGSRVKSQMKMMKTRQKVEEVLKKVVWKIPQNLLILSSMKSLCMIWFICRSLEKSKAGLFDHHFTTGSILMDFTYLFMAYITVLIVALLRGGHGRGSIIGISTCSLHSWSILLIGQICCLGLSIVAYRKHMPRLVNGEDPVEASNSVNYLEQNLNYLVMFSYVSGIGAGMLGIGGGMILNPIMLGLGFMPEVASAVSAFSVLFTSSSTTTQFIIQGSISLRDSAVFLVISAIGSIIGALLISHLVKKYRRPSILVWILFILMVLSAVVLPTIGVYRILKIGTAMGFELPC